MNRRKKEKFYYSRKRQILQAAISDDFGAPTCNVQQVEIGAIWTLNEISSDLSFSHQSASAGTGIPAKIGCVRALRGKGPLDEK